MQRYGGARSGRDRAIYTNGIVSSRVVVLVFCCLGSASSRCIGAREKESKRCYKLCNFYRFVSLDLFLIFLLDGTLYVAYTRIVRFP